jgi:uncharacterized membrane protein YdbT with pleckstrin-like domain
MQPEDASPPAAKPVQAKWARNLLLDPDEQIMVSTRRSIIGLIFIYLEVIIGTVALLGLGYWLFIRDKSLSPQDAGFATLATILILSIVVLILLIVTITYRANRLIITNKAIMQTIQSGVFQSRISRLSMTDVEDVTTNQSGLLQTIFNYGTLTVETAGEITEFVFPYCPNPNKYAKDVLRARQQAGDGQE